jgi:hypothetical protein
LIPFGRRHRQDIFRYPGSVRIGHFLIEIRMKRCYFYELQAYRGVTMSQLRRFSALFILGVVVCSGARAQDSREVELQAQEILARVDEALRYPEGFLKGQLSHIFPDGRSFSLRIEGSIAKDDYLFVFSNAERGNQIKVLYNLGGEDIWVYNILSLQLFHKIDVDRYDPILGTNFSFIDISNADLQSNYTAKIDGPAMIKERPALKLTLTPVFRNGEYGRITLYVTRDTFYPLRMDFHDQDKVIMKTLSIVQGAELAKRMFPVRYDMLDIRKGTLTVLKFMSLDDKMTFKPDLFRHENLNSR